MPELPVKKQSDWNAGEISDFLSSAVIPMRLALNEGNGFPRICSLWFRFDGEHILAATHDSSFITGLLKADGRCAFEIATNTEPYQGVRGQAVATMARQGADELLPQLMGKYLGQRHPDLQAWLMGRLDGEYVIALALKWISAWDYSPRMGAGQ